ncbi:MAG: S8 family serine peptidase, partial [Gemmatimonadetes bacterium]|nr:S8 family serine peptidase [Gemmatimonadota bacterium]
MNLTPLTALLLMAAPQESDAPEFPADALMPKRETRADLFLQEYPEYDGRGVTVAIFDTGVDPGAAGLQVTSDGRPKLVDIVDASGSGDVDTSTLRELEDGTVRGVSGRPLTPDPAWNNPTGEWRIGQKPAWEIFPRGLVRRMTADRGRGFAATQRDALNAAERAVEAFDAANPSPTREQLEERRELQARADQLNALDEDLEDAGPVYDCIVFHDGNVWRAAIDTDEDGEFADETALTNYRTERQWATFGDRDLLNYVLNIYEDGNRLSIVADTGSHGTHVAGIVAAYYPDKPELNGIAPGAQLVSVKIGDTRLGSSSVGTGDVRGFAATLQNGCDLVNMSYGGPTSFTDEGRMETLRAELVNEHGVIFVSTAGNNGPALTSLGGPGGTASATLGVGATVSPEMMAQQYAVRSPYAEMPYNWSSRGPAGDGYLGVDFCAPGGAIAPVTNWSLRGNALMNGTSMAAPNTAGGIALLLSGMKAEGLEYSPHSVRRALANTARTLKGAEPWAQGAGVVQIDEAWKHLSRNAGRDDREMRYEISIAGRDGARGIYLREPFENNRPLEETVTARPLLPREADNRNKVAFERRVTLQSTAPWVDVAGSTLMMWGGRGFNVKVDPRGLPAGAHFAEVIGRDALDPAHGPLFRVPVTVIRPWKVTAETGWTHREKLE